MSTSHIHNKGRKESALMTSARFRGNHKYLTEFYTKLLSMDRICGKLSTWRGLRYVPTTMKGIGLSLWQVACRVRGNILRQPWI